RRVLCLGLALAGSACSLIALPPRGPVAAAERTLLDDSLTVMSIGIILPVILATLGTAWWFRAGNKRARYRPEFTYSGRIELVTWGIPALIV
ncbi:hypothetical protein, partial [Enterococcus faecalis]|uniref:hypothetical protein n=1 Tax=Enterococcus faecalis TaxID=1351 RepID=UPI00403F720E